MATQFSLLDECLGGDRDAGWTILDNKDGAFYVIRIAVDNWRVAK
jgi:hypothetical protein